MQSFPYVNIAVRSSITRLIGKVPQAEEIQRAQKNLTDTIMK